MRNMGTDLEELMIMEAMRQSLQDEEERLAREAAAGGGSSNATAGQTGEGSATGSSSLSSSTQQNHGRSGQGARGTARVRGSTASPATGHSRSSTQSNTVHGGSTLVPALALSRSDNGSLESLSDDHGVRHADDDSDSDQEDSPALLDNRAIRYAQVNLGTSRTAISGAANGSGSVCEGSDLPKHHRQTEGPGSRNAPEAV
ncbi:hypothetical protein BGZ47_008577 [Haplosporangium gracile]|nr:hypothetical protein BGZ47_008577 [Haplosporangium gracile]